MGVPAAWSEPSLLSVAARGGDLPDPYQTNQYPAYRPDLPQVLQVHRAAFGGEGRTPVVLDRSLWPEVRDRVVGMMRDMQMGDVADFRTFMGAVIDRKSFAKIDGYLGDARSNARIVQGGTANGETGYFIEPTLVEATDPRRRHSRADSGEHKTLRSGSGLEGGSERHGMLDTRCSLLDTRTSISSSRRNRESRALLLKNRLAVPNRRN